MLNRNSCNQAQIDKRIGKLSLHTLVIFDDIVSEQMVLGGVQKNFKIIIVLRSTPDFFAEVSQYRLSKYKITGKNKCLKSSPQKVFVFDVA